MHLQEMKQKIFIPRTRKTMIFLSLSHNHEAFTTNKLSNCICLNKSKDEHGLSVLPHNHPKTNLDFPFPETIQRRTWTTVNRSHLPTFSPPPSHHVLFFGFGKYKLRGSQ